MEMTTATIDLEQIATNLVNAGCKHVFGDDAAAFTEGPHQTATGATRREMMAYYSDKYGTFFGRKYDNGNVAVFHVEDGASATRLDASVYPVGSAVSARYEHPAGITLTQADARMLGIKDLEG